MLRTDATIEAARSSGQPAPGLSRRSFMFTSIGAFVGAGILGSSAAMAETASDATLVVGMARDFATFDPAVAATSTSIAADMLIFEQLYETSRSDRITRPALAIGEPEQIDDLHVRIKFKTGHSFHNGEAVTAEDVAYSINRTADPNGIAFAKQFLPFVKVATAVADDTVELELNFATGLLMPRLSVVSIVPRSIATMDVETFGAAPIGSGPYKFASAVTNDKVILERFDDYVGDFPPLVGRIEMRVLTDPASRVAALSTGEIKLAEEPTDLDRESLEANPDIAVVAMQGFVASFVMFNCSKAPFDDRRVRLALMHAINKQEIVDVALLGHGQPAESLLPKHHPDYREPAHPVGYDPEKAKALLAEAGYPDGLKIDGRTFTCQTYLTSWNEAAANLIIAQWRDIGFEVGQNVGGEAIYSNIVDGSYDVAIAITDQSFNGWDSPLLYSWFHGPLWPGLLNKFETEPAKKAKQVLLDAVKAGADVPGLMEQVQTMILEEMPMSVVFHRDVATTWRKNEVDGARPLQNGLVDLRTLAPIGS